MVQNVKEISSQFFFILNEHMLINQILKHLITKKNIYVIQDIKGRDRRNELPLAYINIYLIIPPLKSPQQLSLLGDGNEC